MTVDAVVFDWGGTLAEFVPITEIDVWGLAAERLCDHHPGEHTEVRAALYAAEERFWARLAHDHSGGRTIDIVADACAALGIDVPAEVAVTAAATGHWDAWAPHIRHFPETAEALTALRDRGIKIGLLSNTHWDGAVHDALLARDGLRDLIDVRLYTSDLPWMKPHPAAFRAVLDALGGVEPTRAVYVGDRPYDDISGAKGIGMRAVLRPNPAVPDHPTRPDAVIAHLGELVTHVERWVAGPLAD